MGQYQDVIATPQPTTSTTIAAPGVKEDNHLMVYLVWPLLFTVAFSLLLGISIGGLALLDASKRWTPYSGDPSPLAQAANAGGTAFFISLPVLAVLVGQYVVRQWHGPFDFAKLNKLGTTKEERPNSYVLHTRGQRPGNALDRLRRPDVVYEPPADPFIVRLYEFVVATWPDNDVTQEHWCNDLHGSRTDWDDFVGGSRKKELAGTEQGRGWLDKAGLVRKTSRGWVIAQQPAYLYDALSANKQLWQYADRRAATTDHSPAGESDSTFA